MADRVTVDKWLHDLTHLVTAPGLEHQVIAWVERWVSRRRDLKLVRDTGGNLLITQKGRKRRSPVIAVAHMDHPAFVITEVSDDRIAFEFRGGVDAPYFHGARVRIPRAGGARWLEVISYDPSTQTGTLFRGVARGQVDVGDIAVWVFPPPSSPEEGMLQAPACDDLAGVAASLAALDRARGNPKLSHLGVLLTRAEEVGLIGAIHAAKNETIPTDSRVLSVETSRELAEAPIGAGPIIRTGDRVTVFDHELTNRISHAAVAAGLTHQRKLMAGGGCEATAFGSYGYQASGLCVALRNWHNRGNLDAVETGRGAAIAMLEEISMDDFHGLVSLILLAAGAADDPDPMRERLDRLYRSESHIL